MTNDTLESEFTAKTWIYKAQAVIFGGLGIFSLVFGPLFLFQIVLNERGKPAPDAGIALTIMSIPFLCLFALAIFNILVRRQPLIRIFREGLVVRRIGSSSLDRVPFVPALIRITWVFVSLQAFKQETLLLPWEAFLDAALLRMPLGRFLTLNGTVYGASERSNLQAAIIADHVVFSEVDFSAPLQRIADTINYYYQNADCRDKLHSWNG